MNTIIDAIEAILKVDLPSNVEFSRISLEELNSNQPQPGIKVKLSGRHYDTYCRITIHRQCLYTLLTKFDVDDEQSSNNIPISLCTKSFELADPECFTKVKDFLIHYNG